MRWRAHLRNWTGRSLDNVDFAWTLDGAPVGGGTVSVPPNGETTVEYPWPWEKRRHRLELRVDAGNRFTIPGGPRNHLLIYTDALSIGLYVEQAFYDYYRQYQHLLRIGNSSFEDWAHLQIDFFNLLFERAAYPDTPQGALDRVRLDAVHIVPDGALPLDAAAFSIGGAFDPTLARPNVADRTVDIQWGFPKALVTDVSNSDHTSLATENQFYYSGFIQHEMGHARYLVDVYAWDVYDATAGSRIDIFEGGERVVGSRYMPGSPTVFNGIPGTLVHRTPHQGLMTSEWRLLDDYSAAALNLIAGERAIDGNYNEPANIGAFLNDLPRENRLTLRDPTGRLLSDARVQVFRATASDANGAVYAKVFDGTSDREFRTDSQGRVLLGTNPFSSGPIMLTNAHANGTLILRVQQGDRVGYAFLESADFNLEYWRGHRDLGEYTVTMPAFF